jgi:hypothetical protein
MDKISPKSARTPSLQSNLETFSGRRKADGLKGPNRTILKQSPQVSAQSVAALPQSLNKPRIYRTKPSGIKHLRPGEARSLNTLKEQTTALLPKSLSGLPPYRHIWISHQFDELYAPVYKYLEAEAKKHNVHYSELPCEPLGRHLIFGGFALARDFITSKEIRPKDAFQDREALAMEVLEKLYAFTLAKVEAGTFNLQDFVHVNLLMALLIDWRKGAISEFNLSNVPERKVAKFMLGRVNEKLKEKDDILKLNNIFKEINIGLANLNWMGQSSLFECIRENLFLINGSIYGQKLNFLSSNVRNSINMAFKDKDGRVMQLIDADLYKVLAAKAYPFFGYTDKRSGIGEERYVKAFFDCPEALITVFNPHAGHFDSKDSEHPSSRFSKKPTGQGYLYEPHRSRLSTLTEIDHDYRHMRLRDQFMQSFKQTFGFRFEEVMKPVNALLRHESLSALEKKVLNKLNFFLIHEVSTLKEIKFSGPRGKTNGWKDFFPKQRLDLKLTQKEALNDIIEKSKQHFLKFYSQVVGTSGYLKLYRDMELMLHEEVEFCPKDGSEKQFTHKPLKDKEGNTLLPSFQELYEGAFEAFSKASAIKKEDKLVIFKQIERATNLYQKWKALPKSIRNEAKANALALGYERFFDMAWEIIDTHISGEKFLDQRAIT